MSAPAFARQVFERNPQTDQHLFSFKEIEKLQEIKKRLKNGLLTTLKEIAKIGVKIIDLIFDKKLMRLRN